MSTVYQPNTRSEIFEKIPLPSLAGSCFLLASFSAKSHPEPLEAEAPVWRLLNAEDEGAITTGVPILELMPFIEGREGISADGVVMPSIEDGSYEMRSRKLTRV